MKRKIKVDEVLVDDRGALFEVTRDTWRQINFLFSKADTKRGNHYHKALKEIFFVVSGKVKIIIVNVETKQKEVFIVGEREGFFVYPMEAHTLEFLEDTEMLCAYDRPFDVKKRDLFAWNTEE